MWGSERTDANGQETVELLEEKSLACRNNSSSTTIDVNSGKESVLDITLALNSIASVCDWSVYQDGTVGSNYFPF